MRYTIEQIAEVCHMANVGYQGAMRVSYKSMPWMSTLRESRETTMQGVRDVLAGKGPAECHAIWCETYKRYGWRYGEEKSEAEKTHPCLVSYDLLPEEIRMKNALFASIVRTMSEGNEVIE